MSEYHAAIGLAEPDRWDAKRSAFRRAAALYRDCFGTLCARLHLAPSIASNYVLLEARTASEAQSLTDAFAQSGIGHRAWYGQGIHRQPYCESFGRDDVAITEDLAARLIGLPMSVDLSQSDVREIVAAVAKEHSTPYPSV